MPYKDKDIARVKQPDYSREHYRKNATKYIKRAAAQKRALRQAWVAYKAGKACKKCKVSHPAVIDFHHVIRKNKRSINSLLRNNNLPAAIREAESKCIPLCSNCHRILHWREHKKRVDS
jgi:predicted HNH restriction endonuclease